MAGKLRLGTSSWTAKGWESAFYPPGTKSSDFIAHYATRYDTVEIDATFYAIPSPAAVNNWATKTPAGFLFAAKIPQTITHEKILHDYEKDMAAFLSAISKLGDRLGPLLLQFPYFSKKMGMTKGELFPRLEAFLGSFPKREFRLAVEIRNKAWLDKTLIRILGEHGAALTLIDHPWMAPPAELFAIPGVFTADFVYVRLLGDRRKIEMMKTAKSRDLVWDSKVIDRDSDMARWVPGIKSVLDQQLDMFGYVNNHYSGYAPDDVDTLQKLLS